jgi:hypothetical protein
MEQTRTPIGLRGEARQIKSDDRGGGQAGIVSPDAGHRPFIEIRVIAAALAAMSLAGGAS